ncbi:MAG: HutD family protein [Bacteriovoracia bacterium]
MHHIPRSSYTHKPWKNGLGTTEEIFVYPEGASDFLVRLSMATLTTSGPFSLFPGIDRTLVLLEGRPIKLNGRSVPLLTPIAFPGEDLLHSTLEAPGLDFNLMCRRGQARGVVHVLNGESTTTADAHLSVVFALTDHVRVGEIELRKYDACVVEGPVEIKGSAYLRVEIQFQIPHQVIKNT